MNNHFVEAALKTSQSVLEKFLNDPKHIEQIYCAIEIFTTSLKNKGRILSCGNGGSMCDSQHFAEELTGRYRKDRPPLSAMSMGEAGHITCVANDYGFQYIFSRNV